MKSVLRIAAAFALTLAAFPAVAADVPVKPHYKAEPAQVFNWTGFYGGFHAGYVTGETDGLAAFGLPEISPRGAFVGVTAGYNWQVSPNIVVGLEGDVSAGDINNSVLFGVISTETNMFGTLRARAGYSFGRSLLYATAGFAWADTKASLVGLTDSQTLMGWTAGAGYEWMISRHWSAKVEYLYTDLDSANFFNGLIPGGAAVGADTHLVRFGLNHRFGF